MYVVRHSKKNLQSDTHDYLHSMTMVPNSQLAKLTPLAHKRIRNQTLLHTKNLEL